MSKGLRETDLSEENLKTVKSDASKIANKIDLHVDAKDEDLNFLVEKLESLVTRKLEEKKVFERKTRKLPRGKLITWDVAVEGYHDFKMQMDNMLIYNCEYLNLSTLKDQIRGKDKNYILNLLTTWRTKPKRSLR